MAQTLRPFFSAPREILPKHAAAVVGAGYLLLVVLAVLLYRERVFYSDTAYYFFQLVNTGNPHIEHGRYGAVLSQLLPWLALKTGASLNLAAVLYSISIPLLTGLWAGFVLYRKKDRALPYTAAVLLLQLLSVRHVWFWPVGEVLQSLLLMGIGLFYLSDAKRFSWAAGLAFGLALLSHPSVAPVMCALLLLRVRKGEVLVPILWIGVAVVLFLLLPRSGYEKEKMTAILDTQRLWHSQVWVYLRNSLAKVYGPVFLVMAYVLHKNRQQKRFWLISSGFTLAWVLLAAASEADGNSTVMLENSFLPVSAFWIFTAAGSGPSLRRISAATAFTALVFVLYVGLLARNTYIPNRELRGRRMLEWAQQYPRADFFEVKNETILVSGDKIMRNRIPVEYLLQSAAERNGEVVFVVPLSYFPQADSLHVYLGNDLPQPLRSELNTVYFKPKPGGGKAVID